MNSFEPDKRLEKEADKAAQIYLRTPHKDMAQLSDEKIREDICQALFISHDVNASGIDVNVTNGRVQLKGQVEDESDSETVNEVVARISGVRIIQNDLDILSFGVLD
jgi:osmotically-inducible protein OsmY